LHVLLKQEQDQIQKVRQENATLRRVNEFIAKLDVDDDDDEDDDEDGGDGEDAPDDVVAENAHNNNDDERNGSSTINNREHDDAKVASKRAKREKTKLRVGKFEKKKNSSRKSLCEHTHYILFVRSAKTIVQRRRLVETVCKS
jgi:uncharacterized protein YhaN